MLTKMKPGLQSLRGALALSASLLGLIAQANAQVQASQAQNAAAPAQPAASKADVGLQEIVVTAEKRSTKLQKTPLAVTAFNAEALQQEQVHGLEDINGLVPTLKMADRGGYAQITLRGIGINNFTALTQSAIAVNLNEVYISRPVAFLAGIYDVSDLEVLRGPQGTLYGRNATAGAVNLTTARPGYEFSGYGNITVGNYGDVRLEGAVGGPVAQDKVLFRIAGFRETRDGYGTNFTTHDPVDDKDAYGVRGTFVVTPIDDLKATIIAEYYDEHDNGGAFHYFGVPSGVKSIPPFIRLGGTVPSNPYDVANRFDPKFQLSTTAVTGIVEWSGDDAFSAKSITGYRHQDFFNRVDLGAGDPGVYYLSGEPAHQFSEEFQAHYDVSYLHLTGGLYYFNEHDDASPATVIANNAVIGAPGTGFTNAFYVGGLQTVEAEAAFGQGTVNITDELSLTAGVRYSAERQQLFNRYLIDFVTPYTGDFLSDHRAIPGTELPSRTFYSTTPKFGLQYQLAPKTLLYVTYAKGFKSGGFSAATDNGTAALGFNPEKLTDYEGGLKTALFEDRVRFNLAAFYYDYSDLQVQRSLGATLITTNAATAHVYGAEAEFTAALAKALTIDGNVSWLHARYVNYIGPAEIKPFPNTDYSGKSLSNAPDVSGHLGASYSWDLSGGDLSLRGEVEFTSKFFFTSANNPQEGQAAFAKGNAFLTYTSSSGWHARAFVRNIADERTATAGRISSSFYGTIINGSYAPPRTFGAELGYEF